MSASEKNGYIYILTNPSMPGLVKIGKTHRHPQDRLHELSSATGVPTPFELRHFVFVDDADMGEKKIHEFFENEGQRANTGREFFRVSLNEAIHRVDQEKKLTQGNPEKLKELLDRGFLLMRGSEKKLKDSEQALYCFEQASALNSGLGAYWAGCLSEEMARNQPRRAKAWHQRALGHYLQAKEKKITKSFVRISWLYAKSKQWDESNLYWYAWLDLLSKKEDLDKETLKWLIHYLEKTPIEKINKSHTIWQIHSSVLKKEAKKRKALKALNVIKIMSKSKIKTAAWIVLVSVPIVLFCLYYFKLI